MVQQPLRPPPYPLRPKENQMASIITVATPKGGSGKTTISIILAGELSNQGFKTLIIDTDKQQSAIRWHQKTLSNNSRQENLEVLASTEPSKIVSLLDENSHFDVIIVDTAGFADQLTFALSSITDLLVIPCKISSFDGDQVIAFVNQLRELTAKDNKEMPKYKVVLNEYDPITKNSKSLENVYKSFIEHNISVSDVLMQKRERVKTITEGTGSLYLLKGKDDATVNAQTNSRNLAYDLLNN